MREQEVGNPTSEQEAVQGTDVPTLLQYTLHLYIAAAWQMMGLVPDPITHQIRTDLQQAKIAIDCADFLAGHLRPFVEESVMRELQRQIRDLKVNFVARMSDQSDSPDGSDPSKSTEA